MTINFLGFTPDIDPTTPGAMPVVINLVPTLKGMKSAPSGAEVSSALPATCAGIKVLQKTSGERRTIAAVASGSNAKILELQTAGSWATVSATVASDASYARWAFSQLGDTSLASNYIEAIHYATATTFAAIQGAPKAKFLVGVQNFTVALNTADATASATFGTSPDRWWCHAFQDPTSWTPSITTQAASGRLIGNGGPITAGAPFGGGLVVFKQREMFFGQHVGPPSIFDFQRIPGDQGCVGMEAVADIGGPLFFVGDDNLWIYDGSRPRPVGSDVVTRWFLNGSNPSLRKNTIVRHDQSNGLVWVFFVSSSGSGLDSALVYNIAANKWGFSKINIPGATNTQLTAACNFVTNGVTWNTINTIASTWDSLPPIAWDSEAWQAQGNVLAFVSGSSQVLHSLNGPAVAQQFQTHFFGDENSGVSIAGRIHFRFAIEPPANDGVCTVVSSPTIGAREYTSYISSSPMTKGYFDIRNVGKYHQAGINFSGSMEVIGVSLPLKPAGKR